MSELQKQAIQIMESMSEENLKVLVDFMKVFIQPQCSVYTVEKRVGIAENEEIYDPDYDIDEYNDEIARMFGVM